MTTPPAVPSEAAVTARQQALRAMAAMDDKCTHRIYGACRECQLDAVVPILHEAWALAHCIHNYPGDRHYDHDGPHELYQKPETLVEQEESTLRGRLGMARARYEGAVIAVHEAEVEGRSIDAPIRRRHPARGGSDAS